MVTLKFKDKLVGTPIEEFVSLKPKVFPLGRREAKVISEGRHQIRATKANTWTFQNKSGASFKALKTRIGSTRHKLQTIKTNRLSLSSFDDERYELKDGIWTLPHGHYMIRGVHVEQDILDEPEWGYEDKEMPTSPTWDELNGIYSQNTIPQAFPDEAPMPVKARLPLPLRLTERWVNLTHTRNHGSMVTNWSADASKRVQWFRAGRRNKLGRVSWRAEPSKKPIHRRQDDWDFRWSAQRGRGGRIRRPKWPRDCWDTVGRRGKLHRDLEFLLDFDNWFSDVEFVNRIKQAKRRRIVSGSERE